MQMISFVSLLLLIAVCGVSATFTPPTITWPAHDVTWNNLIGTAFAGVQYGSCASTPLSATRPATTPYMFQFGGLRALTGTFGAVPDLLVSGTNGLTNGVGPGSDVSLRSQAANSYFYGGFAYLANGAMAVFAGRNGAGDRSQDFLWSPDAGYTWYGNYNSPWYQWQATVPFSARDGLAYTVPPGTNVIIVTGGHADSGSTNDVWINQDGLTSTNTFGPPSWTQQNAAGPLPANSEGVAMASMYDANPSTGKLSTIVLVGGQGGSNNAVCSNDVWTSTDYGVSWTGHLQRPFAGRSELNLVADTDNFLYIIGGFGYPSVTLRDVWMSTDIGNTWFNLAITNPTAYIQNPCVNMVYTYSASGAIASKQLVSWGGRGAYDGFYKGVVVGDLTFSTGTSAPASPVPSSSAPVVPSSSARPIPSSSAAPIPSSSARFIPSSSAPVVPSSSAPVVPSSSAPVVPSSSARTIPSSSAVPVPSSSAAAVPSSSAVAPSSSAAPVAPSSSAPRVPSSSAPVVPSSSAPVVPSSSAPVVPSSSAPVVPSSSAPIVPSSSAPVVLSSSAARVAPSSSAAAVATPASFPAGTLYSLDLASAPSNMPSGVTYARGTAQASGGNSLSFDGSYYHYLDLSRSMSTSNSMSALTTSTFGGPSQTLTIDFWIYPTAFSPDNNYYTSTWLSWMSNSTTDEAIQVLVQADGTLDFAVTSFSGVYSYTSAAFALKTGRWQHVVIQSIPTPSILGNVATHTISVDGTILGQNSWGRYPEVTLRDTALFGRAPIPGQIAFAGYLSSYTVTSV